jgi:integrator complex subunit 1
MKVPQFLLHIMSEDCARILPDFIPTDGNTSVVDCISHTLLSALAGTQQGRDWSKQMMDFETAARKVASTHPVLVLRESIQNLHYIIIIFVQISVTRDR